MRLRSDVTFVRFLAALPIIGVALIAWGATYPFYTDIDAAMELRRNACDANGVIEGWYEAMARFDTPRHEFMQAGLALALIAVTISVLSSVFGKKAPANKPAFFGLGYLGLFMAWFGYGFSFYIDMRRGVFPHCADTIAIPLAAQTIGYAILALLCTLFGLTLLIGFGTLPVRLDRWDADRKLRSHIVTGIFGAIALLGVVIVAIDATGSTFLAIPGTIVLIYVTLATRAALLAPANLNNIEE
ncbi:hypothetical protein [Pseudoblastomonas halimionae]|uniref:DUF998 domain-containing protein n=1 Tax=Alteriqipengyuania halimionae TaxID=1926630 RepID=A0A6I4U454_9SPHN|nr:hypothetical protein [Alteriqipengyuania halimionae]MXP09695.1 hypothetical protein [Alteriqipengyuania halimionae]